MATTAWTRGLVLSCVLVAVTLSASSQGQDPRCRLDDKTAPPALRGIHSAANYDFVSFTDVDKGKVYVYVRILKNNHPKNLLPADWLEANLYFDELHPNKCGKNLFESRRSYTEMKSTTIRYGSKLEYEFKDAPLYVVDKNDKPKQVPQKVDELNSGIESSDVDIDFSSKATSETVTYKVTNNKKERITFEIKGLDASLQKLKTTGAATIDSTMEKTGKTGAYLLGENKDGTIVINLRGNVPVFEQQLQMEIKNSAGHTIAKGLVTVHVPMVKK